MPEKVLKTVFSAALCLLLLTGCDWLKDWPKGGAAAVREPRPQVKLMQTADSTWIAPEPAAPPQEHLVPADPEAQNAVKRLESLEDQVEGLRNDISMMMPALTKLVQMQAAQAEAQRQIPPDIQPQAGIAETAIVEALPAAAPGGAPQAPSVNSPTSLAGPHAPVPLIPAAAGIVRNIRLGEHPGKTRIVLDISDKVSFSYNIDHEARIFEIQMPGTKWEAQAQGMAAGSPLVESWQAAPDGQGGINIAIKLRRDAQVLMAQTLPATVREDPRIVVDLAAL